MTEKEDKQIIEDHYAIVARGLQGLEGGSMEFSLEWIKNNKGKIKEDERNGIFAARLLLEQIEGSAVWRRLIE